ncbi:MAG: hypothetical protein HYV35_05140 [Lentisphaerae bacterium]|nr:hypothetical protein [Lentisphaerota bacterium]
MKTYRESSALLEVRGWKQKCFEEVKKMPLKEALHFRLKRSAMNTRHFQSEICTKTKARM